MIELKTEIAKSFLALRLLSFFLLLTCFRLGFFVWNSCWGFCCLLSFVKLFLKRSCPLFLFLLFFSFDSRQVFAALHCLFLERFSDGLSLLLKQLCFGDHHLIFHFLQVLLLILLLFLPNWWAVANLLACSRSQPPFLPLSSFAFYGFDFYLPYWVVLVEELL